MSKRIVIVFGRFNPPTVGHARLFSHAAKLATESKSDLVIFPTFGTGKDDPLPPMVKVNYLRRLFPNLTFNGNTKLRTIVDCLEMISRKYREATLVVGSDRAQDYNRLQKYIRPRAPLVETMPKKDPENPDEQPETRVTPRKTSGIPFREFRIVSVPGRRDASADGVEGMSASKQRAFAAAGDYESFRKGVPTANDRLAEQLYTSVRTYMGLKESKGQAFLVYGTSPRAALPLREAFSLVDRKKWRDVTGKTFTEINRLYQMAEAKGYTVTIYTRDLPLMTESVVKHKSTLGLLKESFARDVVDVQHREDVRAAHEVAAHARSLMEATGKPKPPSEVDKLRVQQQRETLLTKQRQEQELLAAKQRELNKKTREASAKISNKAAR